MGVTFKEPEDNVCQVWKMEAQNVCGFNFDRDSFFMKIIGNSMFVVLFTLIEHGVLVSCIYATSF